MKKTKKAIASLAIAGMALTAIPFNALAADMSTRLGGYTAAQTAVQIADETGWSGTAILASSASYGMVDALTAGPLASYLNAPILLQEAGNALNPDTKAELTKLNVKTAYITSGTAVISQAVLDELKGMGINVISLGGADRFETSVNIAKEMLVKGAGINKVAVAYGWLNQDALSIASIASAQTEPILLTDKDSIPASVREFLAANTSVTATDVIGGTGVISDSVQNQFPNPSRQFGLTAYDTNLAVLKAFDGVLKYDRVFVANGETAIDALAGAPLAAQYKAGIVLTKGTVNAATEYVSGKLSATSVVTALGGTAVVPEAVRASMVSSGVPEEPSTPGNSGGGGGGGGNGGGSGETATVDSSTELTDALEDSDVTKITFGDDIEIKKDITVNRALTIDFKDYVLTGNISFDHTKSETSTLKGSAAHSIVGDLTVDTKNASFNNEVTVDGDVNIVDVEPGTWEESADGNILTITDSNGATISIEGDSESVIVSEAADGTGTLEISIKAGAKVGSIVCNAKASITVAKGAEVDRLTIGSKAGGSDITNKGTVKDVAVREGADGTTITNDGSMDRLIVDAEIDLVANKAPGSTITGPNGSIDVSGDEEDNVTPIDYLESVKNADADTIIGCLQNIAEISLDLNADTIIAASAAAYVEAFAEAFVSDTPPDSVADIQTIVNAVNAAEALNAPKITGTTISGADLTGNTLSFSFANLKKNSAISVSKDTKMSLSFDNSGVIGDFNLKAGSNSLLNVPLPDNEDLDLSQANMTAIFNAIKDLNAADKEAILNTADFGRVLELVQDADEDTQNAVFEQMGFEDFYAGIRNADSALKNKILINIGDVIDKSLEDSNADQYRNHVISALLPSLEEFDPELTTLQIEALKEFYRSGINMSELLAELKLSVAQKEALINNVDYAQLFQVIMDDLSPATRAEMFKTINFANLFEAMKTANEAQKAQIYENIFNTMDVIVDSNVSRAGLLDALVFGADKREAIFQILKNLDNVAGSDDVTVTVTLTDTASHITTYTFNISE